jgi:hypothetical protein
MSEFGANATFTSLLKFPQPTARRHQMVGHDPFLLGYAPIIPEPTDTLHQELAAGPALSEGKPSPRVASASPPSRENFNKLLQSLMLALLEFLHPSAGVCSCAF